MTDIASLSFNVDSGPAQANFLQLANAAQSANLSVASFMAGIAGGSTQLTQLAASLQTVVTAMQQARAAMDGSAQSFEVFSKARNEAQLLGTMLGTTALGLETFTRASSQMNMSAQQTATSLERITMAIEGQSAAARQLRQIMQDYGVSLQGITASNADQVLTKFAERVRAFQMTPNSVQNIQQVLGPQDVNSLEKLTAMPITSADTRANQLKIEAVNHDAAATTDAAAMAYAQLRQGFEQLRSLRGETGPFGIPLPEAFSGGSYNMRRLTPEQLEQLNQGAGLAGAPNTAAKALTQSRFLDSEAPQELRDAARNPFSAPFAVSDPGYQAATEALRKANEANIEARRLSDRYNTTGIGSTWLGSGIMRDLRNLQNNLAPVMPGVGIDLGYTPTTIDSGPGKLLSPADLRDQRFALGGQMAAYGSTDYQRQTGAGMSVDALTAGGKVSDAERAYISAYSTIGGPGMMAGSQRYTNALDIATRARDTALVPGQGQLDDQALQRWILSQPREQQGQAQQLLTFAQGQGVSVAATAGRNLSMADLISGRATGAGALASDQATSFRGIQAGERANFQDQTIQDLSENLDQERKLQELIPLGNAAIAARTAYQTAYNAALTTTKDANSAELAGITAQTMAMEKNTTAGKVALDLLERTISAETDRQRAADQFSGADPVARGAASLASQTNEQIDIFLRANPNVDRAQYTAGRAKQLDQQALAGGSDQVASAQTNLADQQRMLDISRQRIDQQQRLNSDLAVEVEFRQRMIQAEAADTLSPGSGHVALLTAEMRAVQELKGSYDQLTQAKKNADAANQTGAEAALTAYRNTLDAAGQRRLDASRGTIMDNLRGPLPSGLPKDQFLDAVAIRESGNQNITQRSGGPASGYWQIEDQTRPIPGASATWESWAAGAHLTPRPDGTYGRAMDYSKEDQRAAASYGYDQRGEQPWAMSAPGGNAAEAQRRARAMMAGGGPSDLQDRIAADQLQRAGLEAGQNIDAQRAADYQRARSRAQLGATGQGQAAQDRAGALVVDPSATNAAADAQRRYNQVLDDYAQKRAALITSNDQDLSDSARLLIATNEGVGAKQKMVAELAAEKAGRDLGLSSLDQETVKTQNLNKALDALRQGYADTAAANKLQNEQSKAANDLGAFATPEAIGFAVARVKTEQALTSGQILPGDYAKALQDAQDTEVIKQQTTDVQNLRQGFLQMEQASMSAFENAVVGGQKLSVVIQSLVQDLAKLALRTAVEQPILKAFNNLLGGVGGLLTGGAALSGAGEAGLLGVSEASLTGPVGGGLLSGGLGLATGGVVNRGRWMAAGGMIDHPTTFMAEGGPVTAGESGTEAILPLKRNASGNLGVAASGGSGGHSITVNAPITVQGGATGKGGQMDPAAARAMQAQLQQVLADSVRSMIVNELRDGGDIRTHIG